MREHARADQRRIPRAVVCVPLLTRVRHGRSIPDLRKFPGQLDQTMNGILYSNFMDPTPVAHSLRDGLVVVMACGGIGSSG